MIQMITGSQIKFNANKVQLDKFPVKFKFTEIMSETFGHWLAEKRNAVGLNQTELAKRSKVSKATISLYEKDAIAQPRLHQLDKIAKVLGISIDDLRSEFSNRNVSRNNTDPEGFYRDIHKLPVDTQRLAKRQIRGILDSLNEEEDPDTDYID